MELTVIINKRASIRKFKNESISKEVLKSLVDAGRRAPSARAVEPWEFIVVCRRQTLEKIAQLASANAGFLAESAAAIVIFSRQTKYYLEDGCAACENILLAAVNAGLGACWIAGDKKDYASDVVKLLGAPLAIKLVAIIALGVPAEEFRQSKKRGLDDVLHWESYQQKGA
ncbi:MAG: nitroreductase family protein [Candidatus Omnitrophica bacterium]|nr:nitroreductase family protein [Candidatus Omnitrophota bacterium]